MRNNSWKCSAFCAIALVFLIAGATGVEARNNNIARNADGTVDCDYYANYAGSMKAVVVEQCGTGFVPDDIPLAPGRFPTDTGYAQNVFGDELITWTLNDWPGQTVLTTGTIVDSYAIDFDQAAVVLWALTNATTVDNDPNSLGTIDLVTGAFTTFSSCVAPGVDVSWSGLSVDPVTGVFYASTGTDLYTIDATNPAGCSPTLIGSFGIAGGLVIDIAVNGMSEMYAHDIVSDSLYTVDMTTGLATLVGPTGYAANYAQGMDFDPTDNTLYAFFLTGDPTSMYGTFDLTTGAFTPINTNPLSEYEGGVQIAAGNFAPLLPNGPPVTFEDGIADDWTVLNNNNGQVYWSTTDDMVASGRANLTQGSGEAACADADQLGASGVPYDTELVSPGFSLVGFATATLHFAAYYNDLLAGNDQFEVLVWDGATWTQEAVWDEDHDEIVALDLTAYTGLPDVAVSFRYSGGGWDWYIQVDDVSLTAANPAITLSKVVDTTVDCPAGADSIQVAPGTDVYYCYTVENTGNVSFTMHDLDDDQLGTLLSGVSLVLNPGETYTYNHATGVPISTTTVNTGTWTAYVPGGPITATAMDTAEVVVNDPAPLVCGGNPVGFDAGIPPDWTVVDNAGQGVIWTSTGTVGYPTDCGEGNYTNGTGVAACVSSDSAQSVPYDTELIPAPIDFTGFPMANLFFSANYQDLAGNDKFEIDVSLDGGTTWTNALSWDEDHGTLNGQPGVDEVLDLTPYGVGGHASALVRFHYYTPDATPWDWYALLDDMFVECLIPVDLQSMSIE